MNEEQLLNFILETNREILRKLDNAATKEDLKETLQPIKETLDKHTAFIDGNGTPGAKTRLAQVETAVEELRKNIKDQIDAIPGKITITILKVLGVPLAIYIIVWAARVIYTASTK